MGWPAGPPAPCPGTAARTAAGAPGTRVCCSRGGGREGRAATSEGAALPASSGAATRIRDQLSSARPRTAPGVDDLVGHLHLLLARAAALLHVSLRRCGRAVGHGAGLSVTLHGLPGLVNARLPKPAQSRRKPRTCDGAVSQHLAMHRYASFCIGRMCALSSSPTRPSIACRQSAAAARWAAAAEAIVGGQSWRRLRAIRGLQTRWRMHCLPPCMPHLAQAVCTRLRRHSVAAPSLWGELRAVSSCRRSSGGR